MNENEIMNDELNIQDEDAPCRIAEKIKKLRAGNRLMVGNDVNLNLTFFRRDNPAQKCGTLNLDGGFDFSLLDFGIVLGTVILMGSILSSIARFIRRMH